MLCLLIFLVGWLEEGAGGFSWMEGFLGLEVRFGESWVVCSVFCLFCFVRFVLVWMAGWLADCLDDFRWMDR